MFVANVHPGAQQRKKGKNGMKKTKVAKGYRLKPKTHAMITRIKRLTRRDSDFVINAGCKVLLHLLKGNRTPNRAEGAGVVL